MPKKVSFEKVNFNTTKTLLVGLMASLMLATVGAEPTARESTSGDFDIVVDGAGPGGIAASLQASRMGARVALLESTEWIGGQMTAAGVGTMDEGNIVVRKSGVYGEFARKAIEYYQARGKSVNTCYYGEDNLCVDPKVGQQILRGMLAHEAPRLQVFTNTPVTQVLRKGDTVTGVVAGGKKFSAKVVIDAGEYGDTLAQAGANYRIGNGTCIEPNEKACIQNITYVGIIQKYPNGIPPQLKFTQPPPGYSEAQAKRFARYITPDGHDHATNPSYPLSFESFTAFRGLPDLSNPQNYDGSQPDHITRTALIAGNDYPSDTAPGGILSYKFLTDPAYRKRATCAAAELTLQELYYIQHDLRQPWSLANDEGYDRQHKAVEDCPRLKGLEAFTAQLPPLPYVRESRRLIGPETLAGNEVQYAYKDRRLLPRPSNSVAISYYPMDVHGCKEQVHLESQFDLASNLSVKYAGGSFDVPMGVFMPAPGEGPDGLLAAEKNVSASRLAAGAIREQAAAMSTGQAVGALAALAVEANVPPRDVPYQQVQAALHQAGAVTGIR